MADIPRYAVVVMHGIGEQQRYATLDGFVTGCATAMRKLGWTVALSSDTTDRGVSGRQTHVKLEVTVPDGAARSSFVAEFYEYYWASMTKGRIVWTRVVSWLRKSVLTPMGQISFNLAAMERAAAQAGLPLTKRKRRLAFYRELLRFAVFMALFVGLLALPVLAAKEWSDLKNDVNEKYLEVIPDPGLRLIAGFMLLAFALVALWSAYRLWRDRYGLAKGFGQLVALALGFVAALMVVSWLVADPTADFNAEFWDKLGEFWVTGLLLMLTVVIAGVVRWALVKSVGDIALFVDSDERSDLYDTRKEILEGSEELMLDVLRDEDADEVYLVGHSLGSVVALATVDRLIRRARIEGLDTDEQLTPDQLAKLSGLVTFGSPLDKVYYFFHRKVQQEQPVRTQLLNRLHGFRRLAPPVEYGDFEFEAPSGADPADRLVDMPWRNFHSPFDVVSGHLDFFFPVDNVRMVTTHTGYWKKPVFYESVVDGWWSSRQ